MILYHGSPIVVNEPQFGVGNPYNDYGLGFYCTENFDLAAEWACPQYEDGFVNCYELSLLGLKLFNLDEASGGILAWLAVLLKNRRFDVNVTVMQQAKDVILSLYPKEIDEADVIVGYRADDAYFSFARAFLDNRITLLQLERAMRLGNLGQQVVIKSAQAFEQLHFREATAARARDWHDKRMSRDESARVEYKRLVSETRVEQGDIFAIDLVRRGIDGLL